MIDAAKIEASRLDGFMSGIAAMCGNSGQYFSSALFFENANSINFLKLELEKVYLPQAIIRIISEEKMTNGLKDLEIELRKYLIRGKRADSTINDRCKLLSFRVMDCLPEIFCSKPTAIHKITGAVDGYHNEFIFFAAISKEYSLVLQFNDGLRSK